MEKGLCVFSISPAGFQRLNCLCWKFSWALEETPTTPHVLHNYELHWVITENMLLLSWFETSVAAAKTSLFALNCYLFPQWAICCWQRAKLCPLKIRDFNYGQPLVNNANKCVTTNYSVEMTRYNILAHLVVPASAVLVFSVFSYLVSTKRSYKSFLLRSCTSMFLWWKLLTCCLGAGTRNNRGTSV